MASGSLRRAADHFFFSGIAPLLLGYVLIGFWPSYFAASAMLAALPSRLVHVHAFLFVGWIALFELQISLIAASRVALHRNLGAIMIGWAVAMVLIGPATVVMGVRRPQSGLGASELGGDLAQTARARRHGAGARELSYVTYVAKLVRIHELGQAGMTLVLKYVRTSGRSMNGASVMWKKRQVSE